MDLSVRPDKVVVRFPDTSYTHGVSKTPGVSFGASSLAPDVSWQRTVVGAVEGAAVAVPEYVSYSNESGGPVYSQANVPSSAVLTGAPAGPGASPAGRGRRKAPFARVRNAYTRATGDAKRRVVTNVKSMARRAYDDARGDFRRAYEAQKDFAKSEARKKALSDVKQFGKRVVREWAIGRGKAAAKAYAKLRAGAAFARRGVRATWSARGRRAAALPGRAMRGRIVNPVTNVVRAGSAARRWVQRHV